MLEVFLQRIKRVKVQKFFNFSSNNLGLSDSCLLCKLFQFLCYCCMSSIIRCQRLFAL